MTFANKIASIYKRHAPKHLLPFIGSAYKNGDPNAFRIAVIGLNAYISDGDWPKDDGDLREWYRGWWEEAGHEKTYRFYQMAYREADRLARELSGKSPLFSNFVYDSDPKSKSGLYGTNFVKKFLGEEHKTSDGLTYEDFQQYAGDWHHELDAMAEHGVLPHLIVVLGRQVWDLTWGSLYPEGPDRVAYEHFSVAKYETCGAWDGPCYHFANRIAVKVNGSDQTILLVRMSHPAARENRRAEWLLDQKDFRKLAGLS